MKKLELKFHQELIDKMNRAKKECNYNATYFNQMLSEIGGVATAKRLIEKGISTGNPSDGFNTLCIYGRLDLSMEDSVCKEEFSPLFTFEEISYCKKLLGK